MSFRIIWRFLLVVLIASLSACNLVRTPEAVQAPPQPPTEQVVPSVEAPQATPTSGQVETPTAVPVTEPTQAEPTLPEPTAEVAPSPQPETPPENPAPPTAAAVGPALAFIKDGDVWLLDEPGLEAYPLTIAGDILGFTWAPNGERIAAFNGHTLCFYNRDGSVNTACLDLGLNDEQAAIERRLILSPDQRWIVLWNPINPQDEGAIGWMIVALDTSNIMYRIEDPVDWGASLTPDNEAGGFTGEPTFLPDGRLIGTLSHRTLCGSGGCHYQLFQFDFQNRTFIPFDNKPEEGFSEGLNLDLSKDGNLLANYGTFFADCESYVTFVDTYNLSSGARQVYNLENVATAGIDFNSTLDQAILARTSGCSNPDVTSWATTCGLSQGFDILPMQSWKLDGDERKDLAPGVMPAWSPGGDWIAFRSCLAQDASGAWQPSGEVAPGLYLTNPADGEILIVQGGTYPQWQP